MIEIEKNIPIAKKEQQNEIFLTMQSMEVGDSIVLPRGYRASVYSYYSPKVGIKCLTRSINDKQIRVWRIE